MYPNVIASHLEESTAPTFLPVSVADVKSRLKIEHNDDDADIDSYIEQAVSDLQGDLSMQFASATYKLHLDGFCNRMELRRPPVTSVSSITYLDTDGTEQTLSSSVYRSILTATPSWVELAYNQTWPITRGISRDVTITFVTGYASPSAVPDRIKNLIAWCVRRDYMGCGDAQIVIDRLMNGLRWMVH